MSQYFDPNIHYEFAEDPPTPRNTLPISSIHKKLRELDRLWEKLSPILESQETETSPEIDLTDGRRRIRIRITRVDTSKSFGELGPEEARGEGFETAEQLQADLRGYYRKLDVGQPMTVIWFELAQPRRT